MTKLNQWKHDLGKAWTSLAQGWQELGERASSALTWFKPGGDDKPPAKAATQDVAVLGGWSFMAADVFDDDDRVVVRLEAPGMRRDDFDIQLRDGVLRIECPKADHARTRRVAVNTG